MANTVKIKSFDVGMEVKNKGVEFEIKIDDTHVGDLIVSKTGLNWCKGRTKPTNGRKINWKKLIELIEES
ncbi:hypothetical protein RHODOSMS8_02181 [Rhodobiaceae bacterium]|nr:hypothetical protein RHODOSMS8_02181 [Rhodobiaceae bacterium]